VVLPHHALARELIDESYQRIQQEQTVSTVVILGPNHFHPEVGRVVTARSIENVIVADTIVEQLLAEFPEIIEDQPMIENEHAIMIQLPYIAQYFPNARIVPLIFSPSYDPDELDELALTLNNMLSSDTLIIASIDFSHESGIEEGLDKNDETIRVMQAFDYQTLYTFADDHLDAPVAMAVFLKLMEKRDEKTEKQKNRKTKEQMRTVVWETWHTTHAGIILNDPRTRGTSYVIGVFR
jgi:AmmeMemoRadiSam system protein B